MWPEYWAEYWEANYWPEYGAAAGLMAGDIVMDLEGIRYEILESNRIRELA